MTNQIGGNSSFRILNTHTSGTGAAGTGVPIGHTRPELAVGPKQTGTLDQLLPSKLAPKFQPEVNHSSAPMNVGNQSSRLDGLQPNSLSMNKFLASR